MMPNDEKKMKSLIKSLFVPCINFKCQIYLEKSPSSPIHRFNFA